MTETDGRVRRALEGDSDALRSRVLPLDDIEILSRAKGGDGRTVVAYAVAFGRRAEIHDQDGHYTEENHPESCNKTVAERGLRFGTFYHHARTLHGTPSERGSVPLGRPVLVKPDSTGLLTHTAYNRTPLADDVLESIRNGDPMGMSFTGAYLQSDPPKAPYYSRSDGSLQHVVRKEIALIEYGPTPMPAYADAEILGVRAAQARQEARDSERATGPAPYQQHPGENVQCPACGKYNMPDAVYCDQCGAQLPESAFPNGHQPYERGPGETVQCPDCGRFNDPDAKFCDQCGHALPPTAYEGIPAVPGGTTAMDAAGAGSTNGRADGDTWTGERAASTARHEPITGSHSHSHPAYGSQGGDATHTHKHTHDGDANHSHSHAADSADDGGDSGQGDGDDTDTGSRSDPITVLCEHFGWQPEQARALPEHERALLLASIGAAHGHQHERADVDNSTWDGNAAMSACKTAGDYRAICAGEHTTGTPDERQHWALPHHSHPGNPPNANGVRDSLSRLPQTQDLANKAAAQAHLEAHMKVISPGDSGGDSGSSGRSETTPAADGTGAGEPAPEGQRSAARAATATAATTDSTGPHEHPAATETPVVEPQQHSTAPPTSSERTNVVETMTIEQRITRRGEIDARILAISGEYGERALPPEVQAEWDTLATEADEHERAIGEHERAVAVRRERVAAIVARQRPGAGERVDGQASGYTAPNANGNGSTGERGGTPALVQGRTDDSIWDIDAVRMRARSIEDAVAGWRENARRAIERGTFPGSKDRERAQATVERLLTSVDGEDGALARRILVTGNPLYARAWGKAVARLSVAGLSEEEGRALALGTAADGGYAVPYQLDPTVILTSNGAINPLRQISRTQQITGKEYDLVTSAGVTVSRSAEASAVSDNAPTLAQPTIKAERVDGFIPFSVEIEQDWQALQSEMMMLLADAKDIEESSSYTNGNGTPPNASGVIATMSSDSYVTGTGGAGVLASGDLYAAEDAMAPRFRPEASWMASKTTFNAYRQLFTQTASAAGDEWVRPTLGTPAQLLGYPAYEDSDMVTTHADADLVIILGDFGRGFIIIDRLGMSTELVPHLFDQATGRPSGQRGLLCIWRNNSMVLVPNAFRLVQVASS